MSILGSLLSAALYACLFQNLIFSGGYGMDEAVRMAAKPRQLFPLTLFIVYLSTLSSVVCVLLEQLAAVRESNVFWHAMLFVGVSVALYLVTLLVVRVGFRARPRTVRRLGVAAFNTLVLAVPFINYRAAFGVFEAVGAGIGAGISFVIAVLLVNFGLRALEKNERVPAVFRGTPAVFMYVSILALAFTGLSGGGLGV